MNIRHSASCEGVFWGFVALTGLFYVHLRDPRSSPSFPTGFLRASFLMSFFSFVFQGAFLRVLWPTWPQHGSNLRPKRPPKSRKIYKKGIISCMFFLIDFLMILGASWVGFWWILSVELRARLNKKLILIGNTERNYFLILA